MFWLAEVFNGSISQEEMRRRELWARQARSETVGRLFSVAASGVVRGLVGTGRGIKAAFTRFHRWHQKRAAIRELDALSDHILKDIGLSRGEIRTAVEALVDGAPVIRTTARQFSGRPTRPGGSGQSIEPREAAGEWQRAA